MNATIHIKLNDGQAFVFGGVPRGSFQLLHGGFYVRDTDSYNYFPLDTVKEINIKPMPLMEQICHSVLGLEQQ